MSRTNKTGDAISPTLDDARIPVRLKLSALWTSLMFCYVYGDYFGLYKPGKLRGMLDGGGPFGPVSQGDLVAASLLLALPAAMVFLSIALPARLARWLNVLLGLFYTAVMALTIPGAWWFYIVLAAIEIVTSLAIVGYAWTWPTRREA